MSVTEFSLSQKITNIYRFLLIRFIRHSVRKIFYKTLSMQNVFFLDIAASPFGREFLVSCDQGKEIVDTFITVLMTAPNESCSKLKKLVFAPCKIILTTTIVMGHIRDITTQHLK